jgi:hypothetical protein
MSFEHMFPREKTSQGVDESFVRPSGILEGAENRELLTLEN